ncbi:hypothetical protein L7F22_007619 [Adiantum nelumboides]|nr:hypothetical protein [Adiantum nelumboides]
MEKEKQFQLQAQKLKAMEERMLQAQNELKALEDHNKTLSMEVASSHKTLADTEKQLEKTTKEKELIEQGMMSKYLDTLNNEDEDEEDDDDEEKTIEGRSMQDLDSDDDDDDDQNDPPSVDHHQEGQTQNQKILLIPNQSHLHQHQKKDHKNKGLARFAQILLKELAGVDLPSESIYGLGSGPKVEVLKKLQSQPEHQDLVLHFVEDRLATLHNVIKEPLLDDWKLYLGTWGYNTVSEREEAAKTSRIKLLDLSNFCEKLK